MFTRANFAVLFAVLFAALSLAGPAIAETTPAPGTFAGYFFVDRWGQGVFDYLYVDDQLIPRLPKQWRPIHLTTKEIRQNFNPGGAMIGQLERLENVDEPPIRIRLTTDAPAIAAEDDTTLRVFVENISDGPIDFYLDDCLLRTTVHRRGTRRETPVELDEIFDCCKNVYVDYENLGGSKSERIRATMLHPLGKPNGSISRQSAVQAVVPDWSPRTIAAQQTIEFVYVMGKTWLVNEYELQVQYGPGEGRGDIRGVPYVLSPPLSFDVKNSAGN